MWRYLKRYWVYGLLAPLFMLLEVTMDLLQPKLMSTIVNEGVLGLSNGGVGDVGLVITTGLKMIGLVSIGCLGGILSGVFANLCSQKFGNDIRKDAFKKIMSLSFQQTEKFSTGSLITRVTNDITQVQNLVMQAIRGFVRTFLLFAGGIVFMLGLHVSFGVVVACALPLIIVVAVLFIKKVGPRFTVLQAKLDKVNSVMQENLAGARVVKAYVKESYEEERFERANKDLVKEQLDIFLLFSYLMPLMNIVLNLSVVAIIKIGAINVQANSVAPGDVMAAITYVSQILMALMRATMIFNMVTRGVASGKRINEVLVCEPIIKDGNFSGDTQVHGKVEFRNVSFAYPGMSDEPVLEDINLTIYPGETVGFLGSTGCGKTSLVNLIPRFYDVTKGAVLVDDVDVKAFKLQELRQKIAVALQKSEVFEGTIRENISWGDEKASIESLNKAADIAQASEYIQQKENGMDTEVTQGGTSLSGGQRQRLAISRAVLKKAEILILDDATSALDLKTEANLYKALKADQPNQTKLIIAQRISSVRDADRIVIIENGRIAAVGNHDKLLEGCDIYQDIYKSQLKAGGDIDGE